MGTFVAPIGSATVAMPAAMRWSDRHAVVVRPARLNIVGNVEDVDEILENVTDDAGNFIYPADAAAATAQQDAVRDGNVPKD